MTEKTKGPYNGYNSLGELESAVDEYFGEYISEQNPKTKEHIENITPQGINNKNHARYAFQRQAPR